MTRAVRLSVSEQGQAKICRMGEEKRDRVVVDVADALTLNQDVDWDRCAREATPASRRTLDSLRLVADLLAGSRAQGEAAAGETVTGSRLPGGVFVRRAVQALIAFAALWVAALVLLGLWGWDDFRRQYGELASYLAMLVAAPAASACLLLFAGRRDHRTWLLGVYFLLTATLVNPFALLGFLRGAPPAEPFGYPDFGFPYMYPFMFAPAFLWAFARECPRVRRGTRLDGLARRMVPVSVLVGCLIWVATVTWLVLARAGRVPLAVSWLMFDGMFVALNMLSLGAAVVVVLRAHTAPADETRRVVLFSIGFLMFVGLMSAYNVVEAFTPGDGLSNYQWSPTIAVLQLLRFPGIVLLWCSVLAARVPHVREVVRASLGRLLTHGWLLAAGAAAPAAALGWLLANRPQQTVGAVAADPVVQLLGAVTAFLLLAAAARGQLLVRLDAWLYPDTADQRQALADAAAALAKVGRITAVSRIVRRTAKRGCGTPVTLLVRTAAAAEAEDLDDPDGAMAPLAGASAIVCLLETAGGTLRVHAQDEASYFNLLLHDDRRWVVESSADAIVPVPGPGAELLGVLVAGRRLDGRLARPVDLPFLEALGAAAGLAVGRVLAVRTGGARSVDAPPAEECPACGCVSEADEPAACDCGTAYVETEAPKLLAGKYRLTRRLGSGGMGTVYLARDLRLERDVAIKTLTGVSVLRLMGSKPEAWAMATVTHPAVAQIHGIESWRGRPFLVVEFLSRGTLADRLRRGPVPAARALDIAALLADALAALHEAGYLHGDVKPSNVGFAADDSPKLLDFGLARETNDATSQGGTARYLSPEMLSGRPAEEADDVWSLCVMLYEMVSGEHPFAGGGAGEVEDRIRGQRLGRGAPSAAGSSPSAAVVAFAAMMLTARRSARPATASAFAGALRGVRRGDFLVQVQQPQDL